MPRVRRFGQAPTHREEKGEGEGVAGAEGRQCQQCKKLAIKERAKKGKEASDQATAQTDNLRASKERCPGKDDEQNNPSKLVHDSNQVSLQSREQLGVWRQVK